MADKLWGGRFREETDQLVDRLNRSIRFDRRLVRYDIQGSMAHCRMLGRQQILTREETDRILEALEEILKGLEEGDLTVGDQYEDIHSFVESVLIQKAGPVGEKLHVGRSRNDQVALDVRMYVRDAVHSIVALLRHLRLALIDLAENHPDLIMPGYTHLQRAQPVLLAHHLLAYNEMFQRDEERFRESLTRINVLPLGSGALAGTTFDLDRTMVAEELGFHALSENSMDAVSDRDFVLEFLFNGALTMMHLSRISEELILWSSREFGFITISERFCTGSSIMPQKKNPDLPELIRGKTGRAYGNLTSLLTTMKGLPLAYNKDMQEDKEPLFDTADTLEVSLRVMTGLLGGIDFQGERLREAAESGFLAATDLADYLVGKGMTFRRAHEAAGRLVLAADQRGKELHELELATMQEIVPAVEGDVYPWLDPAQCVGRRELPGGTGPRAVKDRLARARKELQS